jgi:hypothetical protein
MMLTNLDVDMSLQLADALEGSRFEGLFMFLDDYYRERLRIMACALNDGENYSMITDFEVGTRLTHAPSPFSGRLLRLHPIGVLLKGGKSQSTAKTFTPSQLRPRQSQSHWVQFNAVDSCGNPVGGVPFRLLGPGGAVLEKDTLPTSGKVRKDSIEIGAYTLELGELQRAVWQTDGGAVHTSLPSNRPLTMYVEAQHIPTGTPAKFEVFYLYNEEQGNVVGTSDSKVDADGVIRGMFTFKPDTGDRGREVALIFCCKVGKLWIKSPPLTIVLPALRGARWSADAVTVGDTASLAVDTPGLSDGENVHFTVFRADTDAPFAEFDAPVRSGAADAAWTTADPDPETPESELYFEAAWGSMSTRSRSMRVLDDVELVFETADGHPLANAHVKLMFGDGTRQSFQTDGSGVLRLTDPRARTARVEVAQAGEVTEK